MSGMHPAPVFMTSPLGSLEPYIITSSLGPLEPYSVKELIATRKDAFDQYHEVLISLTDEAKGKCRLVDSGKQTHYLCGC
uniref:AMP_N domain-containing protein n=1 Tax=Panagrellus redivivus TaxID=6233 RepID=A0A7E4VSK9_PANRE